MIAIYICLIIFFMGLLVYLNRKRILWNDSILNPTQDPFLTFAEKERKAGKSFFNPWTTANLTLLDIARTNFPDVIIPFPNELTKPNIQPVKIETIEKESLAINQAPFMDFIAVGGPPAAMVALQQIKKGQRVLYAHNSDILQENKKARAIWMGAANHGEPDVLTEAPAYITGNHPLKFLFNEFKRFIFPLRYDSDILKDAFPWLTFNFKEWLKHPSQWMTGICVAWGNHMMGHYHKNHNEWQKQLQETVHKRTKNSGKYLERYNKKNPILREPRGSLIIAPDQATWNLLKGDIDKLKGDDCFLKTLSNEEAKTKYGFSVRNAFGLVEKTHDFIFDINYLQAISDHIQSLGGEVMSHWQLERILINVNNNEKCMEFLEITSTNEKHYHYRKFSQALLSLGATSFSPRQYDLVSVTGVSMNALLFGIKLTSGPIVCGGVGNHIVFTPLLPPKTIEIENPETGKKELQDITLIRIAVNGAVGPLNRNAEDWYTFYGPSAINALHCIQKVLPENVQLKILSVIGCNRVIGKDGRQVEIHPRIKLNNKKHTLPDITIQVGAGGGGLTQMGTIPYENECE